MRLWRRVGHRGLTVKLIGATVAIGVLMSLLVAAVLWGTARSPLRDEVMRRNQGVAERLMVDLDQRVDAAADELRMAATRAAVLDLSPDAPDELAVALRAGGTYDSLALYDADGQPVAAADTRRLADPARMEPRPGLVDTVPEDGFASRTVEGEPWPALELAVAVEDPPGVRVGVLAGRFRLDDLAGQIESLRLGETGIAFLTDPDGRVLVHRERDLVAAGSHFPVDGIPPRGHTLELEGAPHLVAVAIPADFPGAVVVQQTQAEALGPVSGLLLRLTLLLVAVIAAAGLFVGVSARRALRPLDTLVEAGRRLARGDSGARVPVDRTDEFGELADGFNRMAESIEQHWDQLVATNRRLVQANEDLDAAGRRLQNQLEEVQRTEWALRQSEERFRQLTEHINDIFWMFDVETGELVYVSPAYESITGLSRVELYDRPDSFLEAVHPDDRERAASSFGSLEEPHEVDYRIRRPDGEERWLWSRGFPILGTDGKPYRTAGIAEDITERKLAEETLRESERRLRVLDDMKNSFLTATSHELRTPLAAVIGFSETLRQKDDELSSVEREEFLERVVRNARRLEDLLGDLLDVDRLSRGTIEPRRRATDMTSLVRRIIESSDRLDRRRIDVDADPGTAPIDPTLVERIVENLLANAVRHTGPDARIWVRVRIRSGGVEVVVEDDGPGVPDDAKASIFEPFVRGRDAIDHDPGVGIGLSLVSRFAALHGGRAWVEDRPAGGASFHVHLPPEASVDPTRMEIGTPNGERRSTR